MNIIELAREAGFKVDWQHADVAEIKAQRYVAFANAVIAARDAELIAGVGEPVNWNWVDLQNRADEIVRGKVLWKRFIDGTPLANDIACWMADFAQEVAAAPVKQEPVAWMGAYDNTDLYYRKPTQADVVPLYRHPAPVQAQSEPVKFLANGTRFKTTLLADGSVRIMGLPYELAGKWVALVAAENDCHLKLTAPVQQETNQVLENFDELKAQQEDEGCWKCGEDGGTSCGNPTCGLLVTEDELKDRRITELEAEVAALKPWATTPAATLGALAGKRMAELEAQNKQLLEALERVHSAIETEPYATPNLVNAGRTACAAIAAVEGK